MKKRKKWTPGEDLELKRYVSMGCYTAAEIAEKLGRSKGSVGARKHILHARGTHIRRTVLEGAVVNRAFQKGGNQ